MRIVWGVKEWLVQYCPIAVEVIRNNMAARQNDLRLYLDLVADPAKVGWNSFYLYLFVANAPGFQPEPPAGSIMIFLKHFDASKQTLLGVGRIYVLRNSKVGDLAPIINERMRWTPGTPLKLFEVFNPARKLQNLMLHSWTGNQAEYDRSHETQVYFRTK